MIFNEFGKCLKRSQSLNFAEDSVVIFMVKPKTLSKVKVSTYGFISGPYFSVFGLNAEIFSPNTGKHGQEITPCMDTFHAVTRFLNSCKLMKRGIQIAFDQEFTF